MPELSQKNMAGQPFALPVDRVISTIPKADGKGDNENWVYPSEQMFWNAMVRKGWKWQEESHLNPNVMNHIISMHNELNENAWQKVLKWEALHSRECQKPKLKRFGGKAKEFSLRARIFNMLGYELPFDRHDWIVDRSGKEVRYIIDYYDGRSMYKKPGEFILDVRPALDSFQAVTDHVRTSWFRWTIVVLVVLTRVSGV